MDTRGRLVRMGLTIKHPEAIRLAKEIAAATGASVTEVVTDALREHWERHQQAATRRTADERARLMERSLAITRDSAARLQRADAAIAPDDLLFDERGLPHEPRR